jgi:hypothetical protein
MKNIDYYSLLNKINPLAFTIRESWRVQRDRIQKEHPTAKIKYSYKRKQFTILYPLPKDMKCEILNVKY